MSARIEDTDVLVIGGGTAGFGAAVAAGRSGLSVLLLEASSKIGGVMAFCPGMPWGGAYPVDEIIGGLIEEVTERLAAMRPPAAVKRPCNLANFGPEILYDHDIATFTMFEMLEESGVRLRLNATAGTPIMDAGHITEVLCHDRNGTFTVRPRIVIDCSGDGDISAKAGVPFSLGDASGNMMAVTISFHMIGVDWDAAFVDPDPYFTRYASAGVADGRLHPDLSQLYLMKGFHAGSVFCNSVHVRGVDGTDPVAVAAATQEGRRRCVALARFLRSDVPGFEGAHMAMLSPTVGVRETRKLRGVYQLTGTDLAAAVKFPDGIVSCDNPVDDVMRAEGDMTNEAALTAGGYYTIPFRSLLPEHIDNLMFAGRILSADPVAFASVRGMPQCMAMGQATGTAAALALHHGCAVQDVDIDALIAALRAQGVNRIGGATP
ncbi:FAD-dependent oxidoreductase [Pseudoruegeria sp. SHC-113]|uniref:FAD-dependent oxidoreductase n=1 Tax=Pseudoruegeria sp. SHC-113 TaxID=2855439 RepID=UPI0021BA60B9|nr:FAD-dependent oxidoreductase [Pseudoruegeria sp. SHC-113]MCT8161925.1 FAD-dependent oxidoreductase [Pseudoruegeria sp. SHC-113]